MSNFTGQATWDYIGDVYLDICKDKMVVEVGPYDGWLTAEILKHNPSGLTLIEASLKSVNILTQNPMISQCCNIIHGDMHTDMGQVGKVDVAILLGIIYHSHAPLHFLEEVVNKCDPDIILIDNPINAFGWEFEIPDVGGMRHLTTSKKTCNIVITISEDIIINAFKNMGYVMVKSDMIPELSGVKINFAIYQFEKIK